MDNFEATVIGLQVTKTMDHMLYGLGIALPNHSWEVSDYYFNFAFPNQGWLSLLEAYWAAAGSSRRQLRLEEQASCDTQKPFTSLFIFSLVLVARYPFFGGEHH